MKLNIGQKGNIVQSVVTLASTATMGLLHGHRPMYLLLVLVMVCFGYAKRSERELRPEDRKIFAELRDKLKQLETTLNNRVCNGSNISGPVGTTYVRWGRKSCPGKGTDLVYSGYAGGAWYLYEGSAVNYLCLPKNPDWDDYKDGIQSIGGYLYGAEYQTLGSPFFGNLLQHDAPCAVCMTYGRTSLMMIPGKNKCKKGWTKEYNGYLMSGHYTHKAGKEYICVDKTAEKIKNSQANKDGALLYPVEAVCGSLPCPPYTDGREMTCVVCTK